MFNVTKPSGPTFGANDEVAPISPPMQRKQTKLAFVTVDLKFDVIMRQYTDFDFCWVKFWWHPF